MLDFVLYLPAGFKKILDLPTWCIQRAVVSFEIDIGLPEFAIASISADFVLSFTICPFKSSSLIFTVCFMHLPLPSWSSYIVPPIRCVK